MSLPETRQKIEEILQPLVEARSAFLVDVQIRSDRGGKLVQAFVDTDEGITIELCADISRELDRMLSLHQVFQGSFHIEVSSPGLDKPLKLLRQYRKNIGRKFKVRYRSNGEVLAITGTLAALNGDQLMFNPDSGEPVAISFSQIVESKEELPW